MNPDLDALESSLLDELPSIIETIRLADLQIRQSIETAQWAKSRHLSMDLVERLQDKQVKSVAVSQKLLGLSREATGYESQMERCTDMSKHLLDMLSKHLPVYQRIVAGLLENEVAGQSLRS